MVEHVRHALAMVMNADTDAPAALDVFDYLMAHWSDLPAIGAPSVTKDVITADIPGGVMGLLHVPAPIPSTDLAGPVALAWHWPEAAARVAEHKSHVLVHVGSRVLDHIDIRLLLTKTVAAVLAVSRGIGVYVGDAMLVRSAGDYANDAGSASRAMPPLLSWVGFNPVIESPFISAYTTGLSTFGLREMEVKRSRLGPAEVLGTLADLASYQLTAGRTIADGDTFGATEEERYRVRYSPSEYLPDSQVAVVDLP